MNDSGTVQILRKIVEEMGSDNICQNPHAFAGAILDMCDAGEVKLLTTVLRSHYSGRLMGYFRDGGSDAATWTHQKAFLINESGMSVENAERVLDTLWLALDRQRPQPTRPGPGPAKAAEARAVPEKQAHVREDPPKATPPEERAAFRMRSFEEEPARAAAAAPAKKKVGTRIAAAVVVLLVLAGAFVFLKQSNRGTDTEAVSGTASGSTSGTASETAQKDLPRITSVAWSDKKDTFEIKLDGGSTASCSIASRYAEEFPDEQTSYSDRIEDLEANESGDGFYNKSGELIPGKTYEFFVMGNNAWSEGFKAKVPYVEGGSRLRVSGFEISDVKKSAIRQMLSDIRAAEALNDYNREVQKIKEAAAAAGLKATISVSEAEPTGSSRADGLKLLIKPPSGKNAYATYFWDRTEMDAANDVSLTMAYYFDFSFYYRDPEELETGKYTVEVYDWNGKERIFTTYFSVNEG